MAVALRELFMLFDIKFNKKELKEGEKAVEKTEQVLEKTAETAEKASKQIKKVGESAQKSGKEMDTLSSGVAKVAGAIAGILALREVVGFVGETTKKVQELANSGLRFGKTAAEMATLEAVFGQTGASLDDVTSSIKDLQVRAFDAAVNGGKEYVDAFKAIGITQEELRPILSDGEAILNLFSDRLAATSDEGRRLFAVDELLNDAGVRLLPILRQGSQTIRNQRLEMARSTGAIADVSAHSLEWGRITARTRLELLNLGARIADKFLPYIRAISTAGSGVIGFFEKMIKNSHLLESALVAVGVVMGAMLVTSPWAAIAVVVTALILVIDDLWVTMEGGDSIIRRVYDGIFGIGGLEADIRRLGGAFNYVSDMVQAGNRGLEQYGDWVISYVFTPLSRVLSVVDRLIRRLPFIGTAQASAAAEQADIQARVSRLNARRSEAALSQTYPGAMAAFSPPAQSPGPMTYMPQTSITIDGSGDPRATAEAVRNVIREERSAELRRVQSVVDQRRAR